MSEVESKPSEKKKFNPIQDWLILPKLLFFLLNVLGYSLHAFQTKFFIKEWGMTAAGVGFMNSPQCFNFAGSIVWSHLADRTGKHRTITVVCAFMFCAISSLSLWHAFDQYHWTGMVWATALNSIASFFLSGLFPMIDAQVVGILSQSGAFSKDIFGRQRLWGSLGHSASTALSSGIRRVFRHDNAMFMFMNASGILFISTILLVIPKDLKIEKGKAHHHAPAEEKKKESESSAISGRASPTPSLESGRSSSTSSTGASPMDVGNIVEQTMAPTPMPPSLPLHPPTEPPAEGNPTLILLRKPAFLFFLLYILISGYSRSIMSIYQKYFVSDVLTYGDGSSVILDIVRPVSEVVVFFFSKQIIQALGVHWVLILSQVTGIARTIAYSMISKLGKDTTISMVVVYGVELLKGLNSGMLVSAAIKVVVDLAPKGCENTAQGLFSGTYVGLSQAFAGVLGGLILMFYPVPGTTPRDDNIARFEGMFWWSSILCALVVFMFTLKYALVDKVILQGRKSSNAAKSRP